MCQVRDLGRGAQLLAAGGSNGRREMEEWGRSNLDVMEDTSGQTAVKDLTYIEVCGVVVSWLLVVWAGAGPGQVHRGAGCVLVCVSWCPFVEWRAAAPHVAQMLLFS